MQKQELTLRMETLSALLDSATGELKKAHALITRWERVYDEWERALQRYANGETGRGIAKEALKGVGK